MRGRNGRKNWGRNEAFDAEKNIAAAKSMVSATDCKYISWTGKVRDPLLYECECGTHGRTKLSNFQLGVRCRHCTSMKRHGKYRREKLYPAQCRYFKSMGCELLEPPERAPTRSGALRAKFRCGCGAICTKQIGGFTKYPYCGACSVKKQIEKHKLKIAPRCRLRIKEARIMLKAADCKYTHWTGLTGDPIHYICKCGGYGHSRIYEFRRGARCANPKCSHAGWIKERLNSTYLRLCELFAKYGCKLLSTEPPNNKGGWYSGSLLFVCVCGATASSSVKRFVVNPKCNLCSREEKIARNTRLRFLGRQQMANVNLPVGLKRLMA